MKQLRVAIGVTTLCVALATASAPAQADIVDILIDNPNITVVRPAPGAQRVKFFFEVSVHNNSPYDLNFESAEDEEFNPIGGIGISPLYQGPDPGQTPLQFINSGGVPTQAPVLMALKSCGDGISLVCLHPNETFVGNIAYGFIESNTPLGLYAVAQDGQSPATMLFQATYMLNGETFSLPPFPQESPAFAVNVVAQNAVPEAHPWVLLIAGVASVFLISSRRIRG